VVHLKLKYVNGFPDRHGKARYYFPRRGFKRVTLPGLYGSAEFMLAYHAALAEAPKPIGIERNKPGSVAAAVGAYLSSVGFRTLAPGTQAMWRAILNRFRNSYGEMPIGLMPRKFITGMLDQMKPHAARSWLKVLRALCRYCVAQEVLKTDPTKGLALPKVKPTEGHHTWTTAEVAQYEAKHPIGSKARLALALGVYTMQRRSDVIRMGRQHVTDQWLRVKQQKTDVVVELPIFPELRRIIDATAGGHLTFLITKTGRPYSGNDFSKQFRAWCGEAGLPQRCTFHGLRKFGATRFAQAGCSAPEIMAWGGWKSEKEVTRYVRAANQKLMATNAFTRVLANTPATASDKPDPTNVTTPLKSWGKK